MNDENLNVFTKKGFELGSKLNKETVTMIINKFNGQVDDKEKVKSIKYDLINLSVNKGVELPINLFDDSRNVLGYLMGMNNGQIRTGK